MDHDTPINQLNTISENNKIHETLKEDSVDT